MTKKTKHVKICYKIYQKDGQCAVLKYGYKHKLPFAYCKACDIRVPVGGGVCLVCSSIIEPDQELERIHKKQKHTPTPWRAEWAESIASTEISGKNNHSVCFMNEAHGRKTEANTKLILKAVNSFDDLVEACWEAFLYLQTDSVRDDQEDRQFDHLEQLRKALNKAGKGVRI